MLRTLPVNGEALGLVSAGTPEAVMRWDDKDGRRIMSEHQEVDPDTGQRLWTVFAMPTLAERPEVLQVRVTADQQPVLSMFGPIRVEGLSVNVRKDKAGAIVQYWSASSVADAGHGNRREHKQEQAA